MRKIRKSEGWVQIYSKDMQLHESKKPSTRRRNDFSSETREEIKNIWGHCCYVCESPQIELHHVKYRSASGRGTKRNGLPLCHFHHVNPTHGIHNNRKFRNDITQIFIEQFGEDFYKDEYDLFAEKKIKEPTKEEMEKYFLKVGIQ